MEKLVEEKNPEIYMVFDVETVGVFGPPFAAGYVVVDLDGNTYAEGIASIPLKEAEGILTLERGEDIEWVGRNVLPTLPVPNLNKTQELYQWFWERWLFWKDEGAKLATDVGFPIEAKFLDKCIEDCSGQKDSPYPLFDVSSFLRARGMDGVGTYERLGHELPAHNPLNDSRQSARILIESLNELDFMRELYEAKLKGFRDA
jgi:hypothetical protein